MALRIIPARISHFKFYVGLLLISSFVTRCSAVGYDTQAHPPPPTAESDPNDPKKDCMEGGRVAVMFSEMAISKYLVWVAATLLLVGILQILVGLFVFFSEALDIYMLLLNYCIATIFCIITILISGSGLIDPFQHTCVYLSPLNCIAVSVPMMTLFLLSYSRFYAITYPFYYVDRFTVRNQLIVCLLSWLIPITVVGLGSAFLCKSISVHIENILAGFCLYASQNVSSLSYMRPKLGLDQEQAKANNTPALERYENKPGDIPATAECQIYMMVYVVFCLILPLLGCIVCYSIIVYQITLIKKNREKITVSSTNTPGEEELEKSHRAPEPLKKKAVSVKSLKQHLKRQTSMITQKAKDKIPVSVILILTLYIFVAVPLTMVEIFNTNMVAGDGMMLIKNLDPEAYVEFEKVFAASENWCDKPTKAMFPPQSVKSLLIDISYSIGLLALALSPWAYIKFTKSFEENLWLRPLKRASRKIGLEITKSVRTKQLHSAGKQANHNANAHNSGTTSGYSSGVRFSTAVAPRSSSGAPPGQRLSTVAEPGQRLSAGAPPGQRLSAGAPPGQRLSTGAAVPTSGQRLSTVAAVPTSGQRLSTGAAQAQCPSNYGGVTPSGPRPVSPNRIPPTSPGANPRTSSGAPPVQKLSTSSEPGQRLSASAAPGQRMSRPGAPPGPIPVSPRARRRVRGRSPAPPDQENRQPGENTAPSESNPTNNNTN